MTYDESNYFILFWSRTKTGGLEPVSHIAIVPPLIIIIVIVVVIIVVVIVVVIVIIIIIK